MLLKGKRTFESFMNAISNHLCTHEDWTQEEEDPDNLGDVYFGVEWEGKIVLDKHDSPYGVELYNEGYKDVELAVVEKAIGLLEGIEWSAETAEEMKPVKRPKLIRRNDAEMEE